MGLEVILVDGISPFRYDQLASEYWALDPRDGSADIDEITEIARTCDGITTLADTSQVTAATIAERLRLPGTGSTIARLARSKTAQRQLCSTAGMPVPRWQRVRSIADIESFFRGATRPAVIKPIDATGGAGAVRVDNDRDAGRRWRVVQSLSRSKTGILEDLLDGPEFCVDAVLYDHRLIFTSVMEARHVQSDGFVCVAGLYSRHQAHRRTASMLAKQVASALGFTNGILHAEFKVHHGQWIMLETAFRPGGGFIPELTERVTGVNLYEIQARLALNQPTTNKRIPRTRHSEYAGAGFLAAKGRVARLVPPATILPLFSEVKIIEQQAVPGQYVRLPLSDTGRAAYALGWGSDRDRLNLQIDQALALLSNRMGLKMPVPCYDSAS